MLNRYLFILFFVHALVFSQYERPGSTVAQFLKIDVSPTAAAMAGAYISLASGAEALHYNPAAIASMSQKFDLVFIDADKENYKNYYDQSLDLIDTNGLIIIDNVLWHGEVVDKKNQDKLTIIIREFNSYVNSDVRTENLIIPVGDGLTVCRKL